MALVVGLLQLSHGDSEAGQDAALGLLADHEDALGPGVDRAHQDEDPTLERVDDPLFIEPEGEVFLALGDVVALVGRGGARNDLDGLRRTVSASMIPSSGLPSGVT